MIKYLSSVLLIFLQFVCCDNNIPTQSINPTNENHHHSNIISNEIWSSEKIHIIESEIYIQKAILKIEPGTTVKLKAGAAISVMDSAAIIADGTTAPITFIKDNEEQEHWKYIFIAGNSIKDSSRFINCRFDGGGGDANWPAVIYCQDTSPIIINCDLTNSSASGIYLVGDCSTARFENNTITNNAGPPIVTAAYNVPIIGPGNYASNAKDCIRIIDGKVDKNMTWLNFDIPYTIADDLYIENATLTLNEGVKISFESQQGLYVDDNGNLVAEGRTEKSIIFTGDESIKGFWSCIYFGNSAKGKLQNCIIEYGGNDQNYPANLYIDNSMPIIENCTIRYSSRHGVYVEGENTLNSFVNNTVTANEKAPLSITAISVPSYRNNNFEGNGEHHIELRGGASDGNIHTTSYWENLGVNIPFRITGYLTIRSGTLHIAKGLTIEMSAGAHIDVMEGGGLIADGSSQLITFTGVDKYPGSWNTIFFSNLSEDRSCLLKHCLIEYGGGDRTKPANIYCEAASPTIMNCYIENSLNYGIYLAGNSNPILINNIFNNNLTGPKYP